MNHHINRSITSIDGDWDSLITFLSQQGMESEGMPVHRKYIPGRGYALCAARKLDPGTSLFTIPSSALLNIRTIHSMGYPLTPVLTAIQLMSLHLLLHKDPLPEQFEGATNIHLFQSYISILPQNLDFHPFHYILGNDPSSLMGVLPPQVQAALSALKERFATDWTAVQAYIISNGLVGNIQYSELDFCWAWLNVNTRCIYHHLEEPSSSPNNVSLCPLLDWANHASESPTLTVLGTSGKRNISNQVPSGSIGIFSPSSGTVEKGTELLLNYGPHSNCRLFVEYGFVDCAATRGGEVDVRDFIVPLFDQLGSEGLCKRALLEEENYWGDWTLHGGTSPFPSYRVIVALRLYHTQVHLSGPESEGVKLWRETVLGIKDCLLPPEELQVLNTLKGVCRSVSRRAQVFLQSKDLEENAKLRRFHSSVYQLWKEEDLVASSLEVALDNGLEL